MFNNLASYLLGTASNNNNQQEATANSNQVEHYRQQTNNNLRLTTTNNSSDDEYDEWVLVDRDSEGNSELSSEESESEPNVTSPDHFETLLSRASSSASLPACGAMEESWFLTPPPCFISAGPVHMETSPLENLLIEHPSMSVYQQPVLAIRRPVVTTLQAVADIEEVDAGDDSADVQQAPPMNNHRALVIRAEVYVQQAKQGARQAQKVQMQKACQSLKRGYLERNNKAREVNCRNQRLRRGERSQGALRSHANNNRKC